MQKLLFEKSWQKQIAEKDRIHIENIFSELLSTSEFPYFTPLREAKNHKGDLLVTVIIHNTSKQVLSFTKTKLSYISNEATIANHIFSIPALEIPPHTSMPWTFIFPIDQIDNSMEFKGGELELD
ncbi:SLAP domain-containing protein [Aquibacillus koreensis]|uniref:SLAP domain-containing protein n=1 Tax=Aquibacillus koreensis TaxID=279446 RepID=A0A9X3WMJ4_9BACI|nr:SLAP domain-containing protein [Aquibacillus koreensis]MCT2536281.1 SLAP domain-containing protein [Aquibacillus koreensis]MDC3421368.1 SLAP domain-containing protein [Aquibacillus koreensis]